LTELGTAAEVYCAEPGSNRIGISLESDRLAKPLNLEATFSEAEAREYFLAFQAPDAETIRTFDLFLEPFSYLHAERIGPRKAFQIPPDDSRPLCVGKQGENAAFIIASDRSSTEVPNDALCLEGRDGKIRRSLKYQWALWMARVFPGFADETELFVRADQIRLGLALQQKQTGQSHFVRPPNTGFGISFAMGILVAGLVSRRGSLLIVENPEAHLHPRAQSMVGEFLARVAAGGGQVIVETHSEHVLNGMRRMLKQTILKPQDMRLHYFARDSTSMVPQVTTIPLSDTGDIAIWPDGFFDQLDQDPSIILD